MATIPVTTNSILFVTYVEKHGSFIKIWGQTDRTTPVIIKKTLLQLTPQYEQQLCIPTLENIHATNIIYCAKYVDNAYYRVRITNILVQQSLVEVHFIDYGNKDVVSIMSLRMIPNFSAALITMVPQAKEFVLANVTHHGSAWDAPTLSLISNEIRFLELSYSTVSQVGSCILIKLFRNHIEDFALSLFNRGIVLSIALNAQHMILQNTATSTVTSASIPAVSLMERRTPSPVAVPVAVSTRTHQLTSTQPPTPALLTYKGAMIEPGTEYRVYVSYVCDGPCQFSIQLQKSEDNLARLMKELNTMTLQPLEDFPMPGTVCVARCVEDDHICRAVVTNMVDSQYKVFYVDFGNSEVVPIDNLFQIPFKYIIPKVMATRYALAGLDKSSVTVEMKCAFKEFVCDKLLRMQALPAPARSALPLCNLYDEDSVNVLDVLQRVALLAYPDTTQLNRGFSQEIHVSYVHSCSRFYVQIKGREQDLTNLMNSVQQVCANGEKLQTVKVGLPCCALFEDDGQWYRAQIIQIEGANIRVRYVDFGNEGVVSPDYLVKPPGEIVTVLRPQAVECCLNGYQNMEDDLERDNILEQLILDKDFTMKVIDMQSNRALVDLLDSSRYNLGSLLLEQLAASRSHVSPILIQENNQIEQRKKRSIDETQNFNRNDRKPLRDQSERGFERQESWRQSKPPRKDNDFETPRRDTEKPWRENVDNSQADSFDRPSREKDSFERPRRDNFDKRDGFKKDSWDGDGNSNWKSNKKDGFKKDDWGDGDNNSNSKPNNRDGFKKDSWEQSDGDSSWKSKPRDGFKKDSWEQGEGDSNWKSKPEHGEGDSNWKSKPKEDGGWDNSEKSQRPNRFNKFNDDNRRPRDNKSSFGNKKDSWGSSDTAAPITQSRVTDPAPFTTPFLIPEVLNRNEKVNISWFHNPDHFFCQLFDVQTEFKTMMEDIQNHYCNIKPESAPVGSSVIALFPNDSVMYRARVLEVTGFQYRVQYVDFGNVSTTDKVWPVENKFMKLAAQAICCGLNAIIPVGETWPDATSFSSDFGKESYYCQFVSYDNDKFAVELTSDGIISVSDSLISAGLAQYIPQQEIYDPSILLGQQVKVTLRDVQALNSISLELPNGEFLFCTMHNLEAATETFEDVLKQFLENFVLMYVDNVLEEAVEVTLYDTTTGTKLQIIEPDEGAFGTVQIPCPLPVLYSTINGWVSHVETLEGDMRSIYIQPAEYADTVAVLLENLFNRYEGALTEESVQPEVGGIYAVHSSDTNWYRGEVKSIEDESVVVSFIDYGNCETVDKNSLRNLAPEFLEQHILTLQVSASGGDEFIDQNVTGTVWYGENGWEAELQIQGTEEQPYIAEQQNVIEPQETVIATEESIVEPPLPEEVLTNEVEPAQQIGVSVVLSHTDSPSEFYLQQSDALETIENLQATLQEQVVEFPNLENPAAGILCAAPYSLDQQWYRAQILDADEDITTVRFVDYGNTDVISNDTTNVKTIPPELLSLEQYARRSSLMVEPNGPEWSSTASERFEQLTNVDYLTVEIIHQDEKTTFVRLFANGVDVSEVLIQEGLANALQLETESSCTGYVSNLNSPSEFWIQLENSVVDLEWIAEQLSSANNFEEFEDLTPGSLCAALFPEDEMWYRARILSNTVAGLEVLFIDYGNSCTCISLRQLPEELIMVPPLAQKCSLQKPTGILQWGQQANEEFKTISADGATVFNIDKVSTGETFIVRLLLNNGDISEKLLPATEGAYISYFETISSFWMHKVNNSSLDMISETLTGANDWPQYEETQDGCEFVAVLSSDDEIWYRARIISKSDCDYEVFFIDYGNTGKASDVRILNCDIEKEQPLAIKCKLEPLPGFRWSQKSTETLAEISNEGATQFEVEFVGADVVRLYLNGSDIRLQLESIAISSAQSTPKKSILKPSEIELHYSDENISESNDVAKAILTEILKPSEIELHYPEENISESNDVPKTILTEIENAFNKEIILHDDSREAAEAILTHIEDAVNKEIVAKEPEEQCHNGREENESYETATSILTEVESNVDKEVSIYESGDGFEVSVDDQQYLNGYTEPTENCNSGEINSKVVDGDVLDETSDVSNVVNSDTSEKVAQDIIHSISDAVSGNHNEIMLNHTDSENQNEEFESNELQTEFNHEDTSLANSETLILNRRLSTLHSEKVVAGFYSHIEHFENNNDEAEEILLDDNTYQTETHFVDIIEASTDTQNTLNDLATTFKVADTNKNLILPGDAGDFIIRRPSTPHAEKIVPGSICRGDLDINMLDNCNEIIESLSTRQEEVSYGSVKSDNKLETLNSDLGIFIIRRPSTPLAEKIVPGSICRGDLGLNMLDSHNENTVSITDNIECLTTTQENLGIFIERRPSTPHAEKIVPGSICRGDVTKVADINEHHMVPEYIAIKDDTYPLIASQEIDTEVEYVCSDNTYTKLNSVDNLGNPVQRRLSTPHTEKIVPGSISRGDIVDTEFDNLNENRSIDTFPEVTDKIETLRITQEINTEVEFNCPDNIDTTNDEGVNVIQPRCSLAYTEKIVPGSICRGDLSTVETEATAQDGDKVSENHSENNVNEQSATEEYHGDKSSKTSNSSEHVVSS